MSSTLSLKKKAHNYHKIKDNIKKDSITAGLMIARIWCLILFIIPPANKCWGVERERERERERACIGYLRDICKTYENSISPLSSSSNLSMSNSKQCSCNGIPASWNIERISCIRIT
jgi:hypothetical protein